MNVSLTIWIQTCALDKLFCWNLLKTFKHVFIKFVAAAVELLCHLDRHPFGPCCNWCVENGSALCDGSMDESLVVMRQNLGMDTLTTSTLSKDGNFVGVSTKVLDVVPRPLDGKLLIPETKVATGQVVTKGEEAKRSKSVVDGDHNHIFLHEVDRVIVRPTAFSECATMDPEHDGFQGEGVG